MAPALISAPTSLADSQWFFTPRELARPPSVRADKNPLSLEQERHARATVVRKLWEIKNALSMPTLVVGTASTFVHRFYMRETVQQFPPHVTAAAAFFLASKVEEKPRSVRTILGCALEAHRNNGVVTKDSKGRVPADENDRNFIEFKRAVLHCEETMLRALCFDLTVRLPYPAVMNGVKRMWKGDGHTAEQVAQAAWVIVNDTLPTTLVLVHRPNIIAAAAIVCACEQLDVPLRTTSNKAGAGPSRDGSGMDQDEEEGEEPEEEPYWLELFDVKVEEVQDAVKTMMEVYKRAVDPFVYEEAAKLVPKALAAASRIESTPIAPPIPAPVEPAPPSTEAPLDAPAPTAPQPPAPQRTTTTQQDFSDLFGFPGLAPPAPKPSAIFPDAASASYPPPPPPPPAPLPEAVTPSDAPVFAHSTAPLLNATSTDYPYLPPPPPPPAPAPLTPSDQELTITPAQGESQEDDRLIVTEEEKLIVTEAEQMLVSAVNDEQAAGSLKRPFAEVGGGAVVGGDGSEEKKVKLDFV
ncbi:cyclin-like protein [Leucosporidium creatinivorum]|uniref:Cyclin-like protein n=1 Tax=Leucosporidium creatinivorum TaxID=106004 RepID=A0A1Y2F764_9BASI|nr:cyclin-like protein [Leucosporidium creatinivorum]